MMEVVVTTGAIGRAKLQSNHHQRTNIQFFTGRMPFLSPNQQTAGIKFSHRPKIRFFAMQGRLVAPF